MSRLTAAESQEFAAHCRAELAETLEQVFRSEHVDGPMGRGTNAADCVIDLADAIRAGFKALSKSVDGLAAAVRSANGDDGEPLGLPMDELQRRGLVP